MKQVTSFTLNQIFEKAGEDLFGIESWNVTLNDSRGDRYSATMLWDTQSGEFMYTDIEALPFDEVPATDADDCDSNFDNE